MRQTKQKRKRPEHDMQKDLVEEIKWRLCPHVLMASFPNGGLMPDYVRRRLVEEGMLQGAPDLFFIVKGRPIGLECKAPKGRQSDAQKAVEEAWTLAGGLYSIAFSKEQALQFLEMTGVVKPDVSRVLSPAESHADYLASCEVGNAEIRARRVRAGEITERKAAPHVGRKSLSFPP